MCICVCTVVMKAGLMANKATQTYFSCMFLGIVTVFSIQPRVYTNCTQWLHHPCIITFEAPYCRTSVKGKADTWFVDSLDIHTSRNINGSSAVRHFKSSNVIEIHNGITFDFYTVT